MWDKEKIHKLLDNNPKAVMRALVAIYNLQTEDEKVSHTTRLRNDVGFSAFDAEFCTDLAKRVKNGYTLSAKQLAVARNKMKRYHRQLCDIANANDAQKPQQPQAVESDIGNAAELAMVMREIEQKERSRAAEDIIW